MTDDNNPLAFQPDSGPPPRPVSKVIVDDVEIPGAKILADGFSIDADGRVTMVLKADDHVTMEYSDDDGPAELRVNVAKVDGR